MPEKLGRVGKIKARSCQTGKGECCPPASGGTVRALREGEEENEGEEVCTLSVVLKLCTRNVDGLSECDTELLWEYDEDLPGKGRGSSRAAKIRRRYA